MVMKPSPLSTTEFLDAYWSDRLILDCPSMTLSQRGSDKPRILRGSGMLKVSMTGKLQLRMYSTWAPEDGIQELINRSQSIRGQLIPEAELYDLEAADISGTTWTTDKLYIRTSSNGTDVVVTADFDLLAHRQIGTVAPKWERATLHYQETLDVPWTHIVKTETSIGQSTIKEEYSLEHAEFDVGDIKFEVSKARSGPGSILTARSTSTPLVAAVEIRIEEALRYVMYTNVSWCLVEKRGPACLEVLISHHIPPEENLFYPIVGSEPNCRSDYWALFGNYFIHVKDNPNDSLLHPLTAQLLATMTGLKNRDITALLVSVAVEGVLAEEFDHLGDPDKMVLDQIEKAVRDVAKLNIEADLLRRIQGSIGVMKKGRARDKLLALEAKGVIPGELIEEWLKLRNSSTHANIRFDPSETQAILNRIYAVFVLLNLLVFVAIGYEGRYTDFSARGWPLARFPRTDKKPGN
jgi:hypothetical protein